MVLAWLFGLYWLSPMNAVPFGVLVGLGGAIACALTSAWDDEKK